MGIAESYMQDAVTIKGRGSFQADGTWDYTGATVVTTGWVRDEVKIVRDLNGREIMRTRTVWLNADENINESDRITFDGSAHEVLTVKKVNDLTNAAQHIKVTCL